MSQTPKNLKPKITCSRCHESKDESEFHVNRDKKNGRSSYCKACMKHYAVQGFHEGRHHNTVVQYSVGIPDAAIVDRGLMASVDRACTNWLIKKGLYSTRGFGMS